MNIIKHNSNYNELIKEKTYKLIDNPGLKQSDNNAFTIEYSHFIDSEILCEALNAVNNQYPVLTLDFHPENEQYIRIYDKPVPFPLHHIDLSEYDRTCQERYLSNITSFLENASIRNEQLSLIRSYLIKFHETKYLLAVICDHSILDQNSAEILKSVIHENYHKILNGELSSESFNLKEDSFIDLKNYYLSVNENMMQLDTEKLNELFKLDQFKKVNETLFETGVNDIKANTLFSFPTSDIETGKEHDFAFNLMVEMSRTLLNNSNLPVFYHYNGREYQGKSYKHVVGDFVDTIPMLINLENEPLEEARKYLNYSKENYYIFYQIIHRFEEYRSLLGKYYLVFNFIGLESMDLVQLERGIVNDKKESISNDYFTYMFTYDNDNLYLSLSHPARFKQTLEGIAEKMKTETLKQVLI